MAKELQPAVQRLVTIVKEVKARFDSPYTDDNLQDVISNMEDVTGADYELARQKLKIKR